MRNDKARVSDPLDFISNSGDRYHIVYSPHVLPDGTIELVESGRDDIQEYIDSFRDQTDMAFILERLQVGDTSVLSNKVPFYGDVTQFPKTYAETLQLMIDARASFENLSPEQRNRFDNDFNQYFATAGSEDWLKKLGIELPELGEVKPGADGFDDEVKNNES